MNRRILVVALVLAGVACCHARWGDAPREQQHPDRSWEVTISGHNGYSGASPAPGGWAGRSQGHWNPRDDHSEGGSSGRWGSRDGQFGGNAGSWGSRDGQSGGSTSSWGSRDSQSGGRPGAWGSRDSQSAGSRWTGSSAGQWGPRESMHGAVQQHGSHHDEQPGTSHREDVHVHDGEHEVEHEGAQGGTWWSPKSPARDQATSANVSGGSVLRVRGTTSSPSDSGVVRGWQGSSSGAHHQDYDGEDVVDQHHAPRGNPAGQREPSTAWSRGWTTPSPSGWGNPQARHGAAAAHTALPTEAPVHAYPSRMQHELHDEEPVHQYYGRM